MKAIISQIKQRKEFYLILFVGCFIRLFYIGNIPGNCALYSDEVFSGYESWSLLNYGFDYLGYHYPVYLPVWGGGMSVMQALCQMPFIAIFGPDSFALRLPAAILGCITLYSFYYICEKARGEKFALFAMFILSIMPWHIMMSRWALDCNYFVGFCAITVALFVKSSEDNRFYIWAFLFMGLTLYTYALPWAVMPLFLLMIVIYLFICRKAILNRYFFIGMVLLGLLSIPLILFILVNGGIIPEIKTGIFSVPKLAHFRNDEFDLAPKTMIKRMLDVLELFVTQDDGRISDVTPMFGLYFKFSNYFILPGIVACVYEAVVSIRKKSFDPSVIMLFQFICAIILGSMTEIFFSRINIIHIPMTFFLVRGLWLLKEICGDKAVRYTMGIYSCCCIAFLMYYFTIHDDKIAKGYADGSKSAVEYINALYENESLDENVKVHVLSGLSFTHVLLYEQYPTDKYIAEVKYADFEDTGNVWNPLSFGKYDFTYSILERTDYVYQSGDIYVCDTDDYEAQEFMENNGLELEYLSCMVVGHE